jgi:dihydrofolate reductase
MQVILYMAVTANGYIAALNDATPWSDDEWQSYHAIVTQVGNIIIGRRTYEIMTQGNEFSKIGNPLTVVMTSDPPASKGDFLFATTPGQAISLVQAKGFNKTLIAGGAKLNSTFMQCGIIDEAYLDVEPFLFGDGVPLFSPANFQTKLTLSDINKLNSNTVQLHYQVSK